MNTHLSADPHLKIFSSMDPRIRFVLVACFKNIPQFCFDSRSSFDRRSAIFSHHVKVLPSRLFSYTLVAVFSRRIWQH